MHSKFVCKWYSYLLESFWLKSYRLNHENIIFSYLKSDGIKFLPLIFPFTLREILKHNQTSEDLKKNLDW